MSTGTRPSSFACLPVVSVVGCALRKRARFASVFSAVQRRGGVGDRRIPEQPFVDAGITRRRDLRGDFARSVVDAEREVLQPRDDSRTAAAHLELEVVE
jgi:hypothetical protein